MSVTLQNEPAIVKMIGEGDEHAFETFVAFYGPQLEKAIFQVVKTNHPVRDILQDIFLNIWITREKLMTLESPRTWLFRMAYYRSFTWLRKQEIRQRVHEMIDTEISSRIMRNTIEENSAFEETKRSIQEAVLQLPSRARTIYTLSRDQNLSTREIAEQLNLSQQTVKNTLTTALKSIRHHLELNGILLPGVLFCISLH